MSRRELILHEAVVEDVPSVLWLRKLLNESGSNSSGLPKIEVKDFIRDCFSDAGEFHRPLVAELKSPPLNNTEEQPLTGLPSEKNGHLVGYGFYYYCYSAMTGRMLYLEDVFVRDIYRNMGLGTAIIRECAKIAISSGCVGMKWEVLDWNTKAIKLYKRIGGQICSKLLTMRMYRDGIAKLAASEVGGSWKEYVTIRPAVPEDVPEIMQLLQLSAELQHEPNGPEIKEKDLLQDGFNDGNNFSIVVAEINTSPASIVSSSLEPNSKPPMLAGFVLYSFGYTIWEGKQIYVDNLFVREEYRSHAELELERMLLRECAKVAAATNCARIYWHVLDSNTEAIKFYERNGGQLVREWLTVTMNRDSLTSFVTVEQCEETQD